jgi:hypothetical protein
VLTDEDGLLSYVSPQVGSKMAPTQELVCDAQMGRVVHTCSLPLCAVAECLGVSLACMQGAEKSVLKKAQFVTHRVGLFR